MEELEVRYELDNGQVLYNYDHTYELGDVINYMFSETIGYTKQYREVRRICGKHTAMVISKHIMV